MSRISLFDEEETAVFTLPLFAKEEDTVSLPCSYRLKGAILHKGSTIAGGHYTFLRLSRAGWQHFDDIGGISLLEDKAARHLLESNAYQLIYELQD